MGKYSLDITSKKNPFINIEVEDDRVLLGAYEDGKIARRLFFIDKKTVGTSHRWFKGCKRPYSQ